MTVATGSHVRSHMRRQNVSQNGRSASLSVEVIKKEPLLTSCPSFISPNVTREAAE